MPSAREAWFDGQLDLDPETLIVVDETGASAKMARVRTCSSRRAASHGPTPAVTG